MSGSPSPPRFVLVTAAYDEERTIGATIDAVAAQSRLPERWVIASDGSRDRTDAIVAERARELPFLRLVRREKPAGYDFAAKVHALRLAQAALDGVEHEYFGVLDADVRPQPGYFEELLARFAADPRLGLAGGSIVQIVDGRRIPRIKDPRTVAGAVQFFRRACFEQSGGFVPLRYGGEDTLMELTARMRGWEVGTFTDLEVEHDGLVGSQSGSRLRARRRWGRALRCIGYHPLYEVVRCARRVSEPPWVLGSCVELLSFAAESLRPTERLVPEEVVRFLRAEQRRALLRLFRLA